MFPVSRSEPLRFFMIKTSGYFWFLLCSFLVIGIFALFWPITIEAQNRTSKDEIKAGAITESADEIANTLNDVRATLEDAIIYQPFRNTLIKWGEFWQVVDDKTGFSMGFAYTTLYQVATKGNYTGPRDGGSGDLDIFGRWNFIRPDVTRA